uniref:NADH-ubiquinone oxidoreductase chain 4L n=1 Tax=Callulina kreffti TaxID=248777 RepID=S4UZV5_9NEOB|nr:NADH dehydrogenase subunit 4L [Callulina kreffti]
MTATTLTFFIMLTAISLHRYHLLSALLCLEGMMLIIFLTMSLWPPYLTSSSILPIIMLSLSACEASLGLSLMIATARSQGSDNLKTLNLLRC